MTVTFEQLNKGWNAEPNAPEPRVEIVGSDILLTFFVNPYQYKEFKEGEVGKLRFVDCEKFRIGSTNDEGWYSGQCRFSKLAPEWGGFYLIDGDETLLNAPNDWNIISTSSMHRRHYLFYFRDETFECVAKVCVLEVTANNSLKRQNLAGW